MAGLYDVMRTRSRGKDLLGSLVSVLISLTLVIYLLRQIDPRELLTTLERLYWPSVAIYVALSLAGLTARAYRYFLLLSGRVGLGSLMIVTLVRNLFVDLVPARIGSLAYVYVVTQRCGVPLRDGLASFLLAFVFDFLAIAPLLLLALAVVGSGVTGWWVLLFLGAVVTISSFLAYYALAPALRLIARVSARIPRLQRTGAKALETAESLREIRRRGVLGRVFWVSVAIRLFKFSSYYALLHAILVSHGFTLATLKPFHVFLGVAGAELSATLPIHSFAGFGTYEAAWTLGFTQLGFSKELAILSGFATHLLSQIHDYSLGLLALLWVMRPGYRRQRR